MSLVRDYQIRKLYNWENSPELKQLLSDYDQEDGLLMFDPLPKSIIPSAVAQMLNSFDIPLWMHPTIEFRPRLKSRAYYTSPIYSDKITHHGNVAKLFNQTNLDNEPNHSTLSCSLDADLAGTTHDLYSWFEPGRHASLAMLGDNSITLPGVKEWAHTTQVVTHETAHAAACYLAALRGEDWGPMMNHGPVFVGVYLMLLSQFCDLPYDMLEKHATEYGVDVGNVFA